jgi:hypothetical protein
MVTPSAVVRRKTRVAEPRSVAEGPPAGAGQLSGAIAPEDEGDSVRPAPDDVPPWALAADPAAGAANGPGAAAASPK